MLITILNIILAIILFFGILSQHSLKSMFEQIGKNLADIFQNREKEYEAEKGRNLATKEDIQEITKKVEEIKTEVSLTKQQRYENIIEHKQMLLDLLNDATIITQSQNKLILYLYDTSSRVRYDKLVEKVSDTMTHFFHVSNLAMVSVPIENIEKVIEDLSVKVTLYASHITVTATNAANFVEQFNSCMDYAMNKATNEQSKEMWLANSIQAKGKVVEMRDKGNPIRDELQSEIEKYCSWLKDLYGMEFFTFKS